ncbi:hypothetical protein [Pontibacillus litoralis]|uniref:Uncharacterized protein n=1 Tax=Pontibacillus litoralis JSM 072002 TaxID=1385512 RepID=A0A0A5GDC1_9BACI|nr:hypothetical protein [Pontibacillus litoralis]KGX89208.1 hypothetical protein N784_01625 [Pontibacillus litoralis JSM 072002]
MEECQIKIVIPLSKKDYKKGVGEQVSATVMRSILRDIIKGVTGKSYFCQINQSSIFFPDLTRGVVVPIELNGKKTPIVPYHHVAHLESLIHQLK